MTLGSDVLYLLDLYTNHGSGTKILASGMSVQYSASRMWLGYLGMFFLDVE